MKNKTCQNQYQINCDLWNFDPVVFRRDYFTGNFYLLFSLILTQIYNPTSNPYTKTNSKPNPIGGALRGLKPKKDLCLNSERFLWRNLIKDPPKK